MRPVSSPFHLASVILLASCQYCSAVNCNSISALPKATFGASCWARHFFLSGSGRIGQPAAGGLAQHPALPSRGSTDRPARCPAGCPPARSARRARRARSRTGPRPRRRGRSHRRWPARSAGIRQHRQRRHRRAQAGPPPPPGPPAAACCPSAGSRDGAAPRPDRSPPAPPLPGASSARKAPANGQSRMSSPLGQRRQQHVAATPRSPPCRTGSRPASRTAARRPDVPPWRGRRHATVRRRRRARAPRRAPPASSRARRAPDRTAGPARPRRARRRPGRNPAASPVVVRKCRKSRSGSAAA